MTKRLSAGQSILEVLFATTVVALVLVAVLSTIIASMRNARSSLEQSQATNYANEGLEWFRRQRDEQGWTAFSEAFPGVGSATYCFDTLPSNTAAMGNFSGECDSSPIPETVFIRQVELVRVSAEEVEVTVMIQRPSRAGITESSLTGRFTKWE